METALTLSTHVIMKSMSLLCTFSSQQDEAEKIQLGSIYNTSATGAEGEETKSHIMTQAPLLYYATGRDHKIINALWHFSDQIGWGPKKCTHALGHRTHTTSHWC
ncbi:hypothetical protein AVEN_192559-1 [Araneus ventricosus]|uniref:Uncharacterized protein n=1 Tax=Araneus ventricosus TaxID=182803 RepID=A0A4Y2LDT8_ARAVE|nr:hypothetical protein AVEN_192559-1 [Araneus ventricosus]